MESITLGSKVATLASGSFNNCPSLAAINYRGTTAQWNAIEKAAEWNTNTGSYTIHCTDGNIAK